MNENKEIRNSLRKMRNAKKGIEYIPKEDINVNEGRHISTIDMVKRMRKNIKEVDDNVREKTTTPLDKKNEQERFEKAFDDLQVSVDIEDFTVYENGVFLSGTIDDQITFTYSVTNSEDTSGVEWTATDDFDSENKENEVVIERLEDYYNEFYEYWRDNQLQL